MHSKRIRVGLKKDCLPYVEKNMEDWLATMGLEIRDEQSKALSELAHKSQHRHRTFRKRGASLSQLSSPMCSPIGRRRLSGLSFLPKAPGSKIL